jgi:hypothetical protein
MDPAPWFPEKGSGRPRKGVDAENNHGRQAKAICALCPVVVDCLIDALTRREKLGIWGGASQRRRRVLGPLYAARRHEFNPSCSDDVCEWCPAVLAHLRNLADHEAPPVVLNGPNAQCGRRSTYARGCRCGPCSFAVSAVGLRFDYAGWDIPTWWGETFGERTDIALIDIAKWYANAELTRAA